MRKDAYETELRQVVKRLDALINIMLATSEEKKNGLTISKKIEILYGVGLRPVEIADILGITVSHVSVQLSRQRKKVARRE